MRMADRYPVTPVGDVVDDFHGTKVADPYRWLERTEDPRVQEWIGAQNALTRSVLDALPQRDQFARRLAELWTHQRVQAPVHRGPHWFQLRNDGTSDHDVLWVSATPDGVGRVLIDPAAEW